MIHTVIMAGGKGTRFWPLSRAVKAKQYLNIIGDKSLLELTIERQAPLVNSSDIWIVSNKKQEKYLNDLKSIIPEEQILFEPMGKNTAPCIGWAAMELLKKDPNAVMVVVPSDHIIKEKELFQNILKKAVETVEKEDCLVTIGINPSSPHTGYGYIEIDSAKEDICAVKQFREKPDKETAIEYLKTGRFFWNSGMFVWKASKILSLMKEYMPNNYEILQNISKLNNKDADYQTNLETEFHKFESISIDYGIMENAANQTKMIKADFTWSDIGNWTALEEFWEKDEANNAIKGDLLALNSKNNIVYSEKKLVTLVDVDNLIVIESDDAIMILPKESDQKIRDVYDKLPAKYK
jgi:mannose-1-phosphate guanylyltransferase